MSIVRLPAQREIRQRVGRTVRRGLTALGLVAMLTATSLGQGRCYRTCPPACPAPCPPGQSAYGVPGGTVYAPGQAAPSPQQAPGATDAAPAPSPQPAAPSDIVSPEMFAASQSAGFGGSPASAAPAMIGDFIGSGGYFHPDSYNHSPGGNNPIAGGDRRFKISENMTPIPTDRVFFSYNHFHNALIVDDPATDLRRDINFDRYTFGFESTALFGGWASLEVRIPFGDGLDSDQIGDPRGETVFSPTGTELGNVVLVAKSYIHRSCCGALTGGVERRHGQVHRDPVGQRHRARHHRSGGFAQQRTGVVDGQDPVGVTVEGQPELGSPLDHGGLEVGRVGGPAAVVDVDAVG